MSTPGPLIVQSDHTVLLEVAHPEADHVRHELAVFAELERSPEHFHTYRITRLGLWNAQAAGFTEEQVLRVLDAYSKFPVPANVRTEISSAMERYGKLRITRSSDDPNALLLSSTDPHVLQQITRTKTLQDYIGPKVSDGSVSLAPLARGTVKQALLKRGWPVEDLAGYKPGAPLEISLRENGWSLRDYQKRAIDKFATGGSGVVVLPCGAGKTLVGAGAIADTKTQTLILVTGAVSARQWRAELLARTSLTEDDIGEFSGVSKEIKPVTIATYQILSSRKKGEFVHLGLLDAKDWGLIIYDEVHLLPAPVFKLTAELQARRRLGLTATLIREDGKEGDVFSLIGPKRYEAPWKELEQAGFIAPAECHEIRVPMAPDEKDAHAISADSERYRISSTTKNKIPLIKTILEHHPNRQALVIGQYLDQLESVAEALNAPLITGKTPVSQREELFQEFRAEAHRVLVVSKVANFSIDLPEASVAIQISGAYGSRQEEAQRLGRIMRPKKDGTVAHFYSLVTADSEDQDFAQNRQRFLTEQGYSYKIIDSENLNGFLRAEVQP